jgi:hypothetical protein
MKLFFVFLLINCFLIINCQNKKSKNNDDDEFGEFDDFSEFEDDNRKSPKSDIKQQSQKVSNKDFEELDITVEDDDEFEQLPKVSTQSPTTKSPQSVPKQQQQAAEQKTTQNSDTLDMEEFENFVDDEEFEGFDDSKQQKDEFDEENEDEKVKPSKKKSEPMPNLKIATVPEHLMNTNNWKNYYLEFIMIAALVVYTANMLIGKTKNSSLANAWFESNRELLEKNFALVGDDGTNTDVLNAENVKLIKESDNIFGIWCSGRQSCLNMFIQLKFLKRQDLISVISGLIKPQNDQIIISVEFDRKDLDSYVFCLANRKQSSNLMRDYQDVGTYCAEKKQLSDKYDISSKYVILNEIGEIPSAILDTRVCGFLKSYEDLIEYILISDQYVGYKIQQDDQQNVQNKPAPTSNGELVESSVGLQNGRAMMVICINIPKSNKYSITNEDIEKVQPALMFALYLVDKIPRVILSKDAKAKAVKRRREITEQNMKLVNKQRQEAAQQRKEEKRRAEQDAIMNEEDPEKQKKLEERQLKRDKKPKLKQIKIKSM